MDAEYGLIFSQEQSPIQGSATHKTMTQDDKSLRAAGAAFAATGSNGMQSRQGKRSRFNTVRNPVNARNTKANPYLSDTFKEREFFLASNAYHRLDKSQNFLGNKAFATTVINELKQRQRQSEYQRRLGTEADKDSEHISQLHKEASREMFKKQQSEIYQS